jgi:hypothetical protein
MGIKELTMPTGITNITQSDIEKMLDMLPDGSLYMCDADGEFNQADIDTHFANLPAFKAAPFTKFGELGKKVGSFDSKTDMIEIRNSSKVKGRTTTLSVVTTGISEEQKQYFDTREFRKKPKVLVLMDQEERQALVYGNLIWGADFKGDADSQFEITFNTKFGGMLHKNVFIVHDIPASA